MMIKRHLICVGEKFNIIIRKKKYKLYSNYFIIIETKKKEEDNHYIKKRVNLLFLNSFNKRRIKRKIFIIKN